MSAMDFKSKGKILVGNIYQKFESIRLEVDNLMSEDTVKYTGRTLDKNHEAQQVVTERKAYTESVVVKENHLDFVNEHLTHGINELLIVNQNLTQTSAVSLENPISDSTRQQFDDDKIVEKSMSPRMQHFAIPDEEACINGPLDNFIDSNWENTLGHQANNSPVCSIKREEFTEMGLKSSMNRSLSLESFTSIENVLTDGVLSCNGLIDVAQLDSEHLSISSNNNVTQSGLGNSSSPLPLEESCGPPEECYEDISESEMENVDLCDSVKLEDICIFADDSELYAVSRRTQKLRSYKKKIQDAFSSRKRLAKEYQQIAIWYGDTDVGPSQDPSHTLMPTIPSTTLDSENSGAQDISDWELL